MTEKKTATPIVCSNDLQIFISMMVHWTKHANFWKDSPLSGNCDRLLPLNFKPLVTVKTHV